MTREAMELMTAMGKVFEKEKKKKKVVKTGRRSWRHPLVGMQ